MIIRREDMKKQLVAMIVAGAMVASMVPAVAAYAEEAESAAAGTEESTDTTEDEKKEPSKSAYLLAEGYEIMDGLTIPVGLTNKDLEADDLEPEMAEKLISWGIDYLTSNILE
jgi:hypothetical protein